MKVVTTPHVVSAMFPPSIPHQLQCECPVGSQVHHKPPSLTPLPSGPQVFSEACSSIAFPQGHRFHSSTANAVVQFFSCFLKYFILGLLPLSLMGIVLASQHVHPGDGWHQASWKCRKLLADSQRNHPCCPLVTKTWPLRLNTHSLQLFLLM